MSSRSTDKPPIVHLFDLDFFAGSFVECVEMIQARLADDKADAKSVATFVIDTPNPEQIVLSKKNREFLQYLQRADLLLPDGVGIVWASKLLAKDGIEILKERIAGVDLVYALLQYLQKSGQGALLIGGRGYDQVEKFPEHLLWAPGYEDVQNPQPAEEKNLLSLIEKVKPAVLFVAFGAPWQEKWIDEHLEFLASNHVKVVMSVGGSFDFLFGKVSRAPQWMQKSGLEWLYRLIAQPWRWRRQLQLITFIGYVFREKFQ